MLPTLVALGLVAVGGGYGTVRSALDAAAYPRPGVMVDVGAYALHLDCAGRGSPTVVLESGLGGSSTLWSRVVADVSPTTRVCAYDRAGQGWSDSAESPRDADAIAADLRLLLEGAGEAGPYVLVGHSAGGPYVMTFAARDPGAVAGMVLLDATDPYGVDGTVAGRTGGAGGPVALLPSLARLGLTRPLPASFWSALPLPAADTFRAYAASPRAMRNAVDELSRYGAAFARAQTLTTLGSRPLVVLTTVDTARTNPSGFAAQERLAALSRDSSLRTADSSHAGLLDEPRGAAASARAVTDVVAAVRAGMPVAPG